MAEIRPHKDEKLESIITRLASDFILHESSGQSMITITRTKAATHGKAIKIFFTVLPDERAEQALDFLKRKRTEFKHYLKEKSRIGLIPHVDFILDEGEISARKLESLLK